jgi:hypothetical protein
MIRITIGLLTGFIALTAIGGGIALLIGIEGERFPLEWLQGTPFTDYTIPALLLALVVGAVTNKPKSVTTTARRRFFNEG